LNFYLFDILCTIYTNDLYVTLIYYCFKGYCEVSINDGDFSISFEIPVGSRDSYMFGMTFATDHAVTIVHDDRRLLTAIGADNAHGAYNINHANMMASLKKLLQNILCNHPSTRRHPLLRSYIQQQAAIWATTHRHPAAEVLSASKLVCRMESLIENTLGHACLNAFFSGNLRESTKMKVSKAEKRRMKKKKLIAAIKRIHSESHSPNTHADDEDVSESSELNNLTVNGFVQAICWARCAKDKAEALMGESTAGHISDEVRRGGEMDAETPVSSCAPSRASSLFASTGSLEISVSLSAVAGLVDSLLDSNEIDICDVEIQREIGARRAEQQRQDAETNATGAAEHRRADQQWQAQHAEQRRREEARAAAEREHRDLAEEYERLQMELIMREISDHEQRQS